MVTNEAELHAHLGEVVLRNGEHIDAGSIQVVVDAYRTLKSFEPSADRKAAVLNEVRRRFNPNQELLGCASCGARYAVEMERNRDGTAVAGYEYSLSDLSRLKLTPDQIVDYCSLKGEARYMRSVYPPPTVENVEADLNPQTTTLYYLHPEFVRKPAVDVATMGADVQEAPLGYHVATLCFNCHEGVRQVQSGAHQRKLHKFCLAEGFDFGDIRRIPNWKVKYPPLTIAERMVLSTARPYSVVIQQSLVKGATQGYKLASHCITMPFGGVEVLNAQNVAERGRQRGFRLPRPLEEIQQRFKVMFIGAADFNKIRSACLAGLKHGYVRKQIIYNYLHLMARANPIMAPFIDLPNNVADVPDYAPLAELPEYLADATGERRANRNEIVPLHYEGNSVMIVNDPVLVAVHRQAADIVGRDVANARVFDDEGEEVLANPENDVAVVVVNREDGTAQELVHHDDFPIFVPPPPPGIRDYPKPLRVSFHPGLIPSVCGSS